MALDDDGSLEPLMAVGTRIVFVRENRSRRRGSALASHHRMTDPAEWIVEKRPFYSIDPRRSCGPFLVLKRW